MRFLYVDRPACGDGRTTLGREDARRLRKVLRLGPGDELAVRFRSDGVAATAVIESLSSSEAVLRIEPCPSGRPVSRREPGRGPQSEPPAWDGRSNAAAGLPPADCLEGLPALHVAVAMLKGGKLDFIVQKLTELAVSSIYFLETERSVVRYLGPNQDRRLRRIAEEACQQCGRPLPPVFGGVVSPGDFCTVMSGGGVETCILHEGPEARMPAQGELAELSSSGLAVMLGPEGGFSPFELETCTRGGARALRLPGFVLRADTAAVAVAAMLLPFRFGRR